MIESTEPEVPGGLMSVAFNQILENIRELTSNERALVAHCLISSLESKQDDGVDEAWAKLAEKRYAELESGAVKGISWQEIKAQLKG
jgi:putative addiction module component (TIGR02574 family)